MFKTTIKQKEKENGRDGEDLMPRLLQADAVKSRMCEKKIYFVFDDVFVIIIRVTFSFFLEMKCYKIDQFFHGYGILLLSFCGLNAAGSPR